MSRTFPEAESFAERYSDELSRFGIGRDDFLATYRAATPEERREMIRETPNHQELTPTERLTFRNLVHEHARDIERSGTTVACFCETFAKAPPDQQRAIIGELSGTFCSAQQARYSP